MKRKDRSFIPTGPVSRDGDMKASLSTPTLARTRLRSRRRALVAIACLCVLGDRRTLAFTRMPASDPDAQSSPMAAEEAARRGYRTITWRELVPPDWNPRKGLDTRDWSRYRDADPRAAEALRKLMEAWRAAPVNASLDHRRVRISGFVIPLDAEHGRVREFLLVPYFGACIHVPPPPANQIIDVTAAEPVKGMHMMQTVWVLGPLKIERKETMMGASGYEIRAESVVPYRAVVPP